MFCDLLALWRKVLCKVPLRISYLIVRKSRCLRCCRCPSQVYKVVLLWDGGFWRPGKVCIQLILTLPLRLQFNQVFLSKYYIRFAIL